MKHKLAMPAIALAAVMALAGCGATPGEGPVSGQSQGSTEAAHNDADVSFAQGMIPHHRQAVEMSEVLLEKDGVDSQVTELATQIKDAQAPEIEIMTTWLDSWGEPLEASGAAGHGEGHGTESTGESDGALGMMTGDQLAELDSTDGAEASRLFLSGMIEHHEGAVDMAQQQIDGGSNPRAVELAEEIVATQQAEIDEMNALLGEL